MATIIEEKRESAVRPSAMGTGTYFVRRGFAWSGIWAGAFVAMALQLLCGLLAIWGSPNSVVLGGQLPLTGVSTGVGVWYLIYTFGAMFVGGFTASKQSADPGGRSLHALGAWAVATVLGFYGLGVIAERMGFGLATPAGNVITGTASAGISMISPGWMFGGLLLGLIAALLAASVSEASGTE